jgi:hypothetical protein
MVAVLVRACCWGRWLQEDIVFPETVSPWFQFGGRI